VPKLCPKYVRNIEIYRKPNGLKNQRFTGITPYIYPFPFFLCLLHTVEVTGSNPVSPTTLFSISCVIPFSGNDLPLIPIHFLNYNLVLPEGKSSHLIRDELVCWRKIPAIQYHKFLFSIHACLIVTKKRLYKYGLRILKPRREECMSTKKRPKSSNVNRLGVPLSFHHHSI